MLALETPVRNGLLARLPAQDLDRLRHFLTRVELKPRRVLHHWNMPMEQVYFVERGLVSVMARTDPNCAVEVWLIGREGMTGIPVILGRDSAPPHRRVVQVGGSALRIRASDLRRAVDEIPSLRDVLLRYVQVVLLQTSQIGACNGRHALQQRLARWLLMAHDRLDDGELPLTHATLSRMLGVRRASVTDAISAMQRSGIVETQPGRVRIVDAAKLETVSCGCQRAIRLEYDRLLRSPGGTAAIGGSAGGASDRADDPNRS